MRSGVKARRTLFTWFLLAGAGCFPASALADGFGWYVYFLDYGQLERQMAGELGAAFRDADEYPFTPDLKGSAFILIDLLRESDSAILGEPRMYDGEHLGAQALQEFGAELQRRKPGSAGRFFQTGRQFLGFGRMPACGSTVWIHGACGSAMLFTPAEATALFREVNELVAARVKWSTPEASLDLLRLRDILQEAALLKRAAFFYGHD